MTTYPQVRLNVWPWDFEGDQGQGEAAWGWIQLTSPINNTVIISTMTATEIIIHFPQSKSVQKHSMKTSMKIPWIIFIFIPCTAVYTERYSNNITTQSTLDVVHTLLYKLAIYRTRSVSFNHHRLLILGHGKVDILSAD